MKFLPWLLLLSTVGMQAQTPKLVVLNKEGTHMLALNPDGTVIYTVNKMLDSIGILKPLKKIAVGRNPAGILIAPDGAKVYIAGTDSNYIAVLDLKTLEITGKLETGRGPDGMTWAGIRE